MSATVVTSAVTVTANQSVVVVTSTIGAGDPTGTGSVSSSGVDTGSGVTSPTAAPTVSSSSDSNNGSGSNHSSLVPALVGGILGGLALVVLLILLACLMKRRSRSRKQKSPFPDDTIEKNPRVIAGLPPNPSSSSALHGGSGHHPNSLSALPLLAAADRPFPRAESSYAFSKRPSSGSLAPSGHTYMHSPPQHHATPNRYSYVSTGHSPNPSTFSHADTWTNDGRQPDPYWSPPRSNAVPEPSYANPRVNAPSLPLGAAAPNYSAAHDAVRNDLGSAPAQTASNSPPLSSQPSYTPQPMQTNFGPPARAPPGVARTPTLSTIPGSVSERHTELSHAHELGAPKLPTIPTSSPLILQDSTMGSSGDLSQRRHSGQQRSNPPDQSGDTYNGEYWITAPIPEDQRAEQRETSASRASLNTSGSRMFEMLDTGNEPPEAESSRAGEPRPSFWRERSVSSHSIRRVFRGSPRNSVDHRN